MAAAFGIDLIVWLHSVQQLLLWANFVRLWQKPWAEQETLVMIGCGDEHAACLGAGVARAGLVGDIAGTAEPVLCSKH